MPRTFPPPDRFELVDCYAERDNEFDDRDTADVRSDEAQRDAVLEADEADVLEQRREIPDDGDERRTAGD
ncbi:hypothetical protein [Mycolicibacterium arenosum]|uniref:Uncharacterized protein n=1 Tax=Mycolicibacterium arenosum TaxID=2952157 RepID=A0ABT1LUN6_9MYCO|nr:hypothetical protein [Mycolicibacterium sp. CAU 1645]MCP9270619.1 hypothetical protein [Mycolicibacterium sp. CAU 1645]